MTRDEIDAFYRAQPSPWNRSPSQTMDAKANPAMLQATAPANPVDRVRQGVTDSDWFRALAPEAQRTLSGAGELAEFAPPVAAARGGYDIGAGIGASDAAQAAGGLVNAIPELKVGGLAMAAAPGLKRAVKAGDRLVGPTGEAVTVPGAVETASAPMIRAYHGTPHDFDRFSMDKIGTGEGAQVYGHGLYFAENEDTAKSYRDALRPLRVAGGDGRALSPTEADEHLIGHALKHEGVTQADADYISSSFTEAVREGLDIDKLERNFLDSGGYKPSDGFYKAIKSVAGESRKLQLDKGHMYEVGIKADPAHFLDWDKSLTEQPQGVQDLARNADLSHLSPNNRTRRQLEMWREGTLPNPESAPTGNVLHSALANYGEDSASNAAFTDKLREAGIPGIRYLDQGSRNASGKPGTSNYVVFNEQLIDIMRKYGIAGLAMLGVGGGAAMQGGGEQGAPRS